MESTRITIKHRHSASTAYRFYERCNNCVEKKRAHFIWLLLENYDIQEAEDTVGFSHTSGLEIIKNYNKHGFNGLKDKRRFNKGRPPLLSDSQVLLLAQIIRHDYNDGILWNPRKVREWMEQELKHSVYLSKVYSYISIIGFSLQAPRPKHEENIDSILEEFKKNFTKNCRRDAFNLQQSSSLG